MQSNFQGRDTQREQGAFSFLIWPAFASGDSRHWGGFLLFLIKMCAFIAGGWA